MRTFPSQHQPARRGSLHISSSSRSSSSSMSSGRTSSITLAALFILAIPACAGAPADRQQIPADQGQLLQQIDAVCTTYLYTDTKSWASDLIGELCVMMLVENSKDRRVKENIKRTSESRPLLYLATQLRSRKERELERESSMRAELKGPGGIVSKGYFLYRPRNGRRSLEYE